MARNSQLRTTGPCHADAVVLRGCGAGVTRSRAETRVLLPCCCGLEAANGSWLGDVGSNPPSWWLALIGSAREAWPALPITCFQIGFPSLHSTAISLCHSNAGPEILNGNAIAPVSCPTICKWKIGKARMNLRKRSALVPSEILMHCLLSSHHMKSRESYAKSMPYICYINSMFEKRKNISSCRNNAL
jgi:hypothetical protein